MPRKSAYSFLALLILASSLAGCGSPAASDESPTTSPAASPAVVLPSPTPLLVGPTLAPGQSVVTGVGEMVGVWTARYVDYGLGFIRYHEDGTFEMAATVPELENHPAVRGTVAFQGYEMTTRDTSCGTGVYEVRITRADDGTPLRLEFYPIDDSCDGRVRDMRRGMEWVAP